MKRMSRITRHKLPICRATGLDRYRDRHQARHGAAASCASDRAAKLTAFACPECRGFHLEKLRRPSLRMVEPAVDAAALASAPRHYVLADIENLVAGQATRREAKALWRVLAQESPGITAKDHVVIGGNRYVAMKFSTTIAGNNIKWVVGADGPDGADRPLLVASNIHQIRPEVRRTCHHVRRSRVHRAGAPRQAPRPSDPRGDDEAQQGRVLVVAPARSGGRYQHHGASRKGGSPHSPDRPDTGGVSTVTRRVGKEVIPMAKTVRQ